jgi:hypothetical protein
VAFASDVAVIVFKFGMVSAPSAANNGPCLAGSVLTDDALRTGTC